MELTMGLVFFLAAIVFALAIVIWAIRELRDMGKGIREHDKQLIDQSQWRKKINLLMHDYEKEVFGMWGGDKAKADAMTAEEIQQKWEEHQRRLRDLGFF